MKFRKIPEVVEAVQFTGDNLEEILMFCPLIKVDAKDNSLSIPASEYSFIGFGVGYFIIKKIEGNAIKFYAMVEESFNETYEKV